MANPNPFQKQATPADATASQMTIKQAEQLRERCRSVVLRHKKLSLELCEAVWESEGAVVKVGTEYKYCWTLWGYTSWEEFVGKEMDLHLRTAYILSNVWEIFGIQLKGSWDPELLLGITKMKILTVAPLTRKNVESWLRRAKMMTCHELRAKVYNTEEIHTLALPLTSSQLKAVNGALDMAKSTVSNGEKMKRGDLLAHIVSTWQQQNKPRLRSAAA